MTARSCGRRPPRPSPSTRRGSPATTCRCARPPPDPAFADPRLGNLGVVPRLRRTDCSTNGLTRKRRGKRFHYFDACGARVTDPETVSRIEALAIPPAWEQVWICPWPNGHIQATGIDARGRRQYRYHDAWRTHRDREKFEHMLAFARAL